MNAQEIAAETILQEWGRWVARDRVPCDWPETTPIYNGMRAADPWLEAARHDAPVEPEWFGQFNAFLRKEISPIQVTFARLLLAERMSFHKARRALRMSLTKARNTERRIRVVARAFIA